MTLLVMDTSVNVNAIRLAAQLFLNAMENLDLDLLQSCFASEPTVFSGCRNEAACNWT